MLVTPLVVTWTDWPTISEPGGVASYTVTIENDSTTESVTITEITDSTFVALTAVAGDITATD